MNDFWKENDLDWSQSDLRSLGHPQRPRQTQPWGVQQLPFIFIKMNIWNMFHDWFSKTKRPGWVPRWSEGSRTPSAPHTKHNLEQTLFLSLFLYNLSLKILPLYWCFISFSSRLYPSFDCKHSSRPYQRGKLCHIKYINSNIRNRTFYIARKLDMLYKMKKKHVSY